MPRECLAVSDNHCAAEVARSIGLTRSAAILQAAIGSHPEPYLGLVLGATNGSETSLLDLVSGYTAFLNQGIRMLATPGPIPIPGSRIFSAGAAFITADLLRTVVSAPHGTASVLNQFARSTATPLIAKTGTAQRSDFWVVAAAR